jgi:hypothetical protein
LGGYVLGAAWVAAMAAAFNAMRVEGDRQPADAKGGLEPEIAPRLSGTTARDEEPDDVQ